MFSPWKVIDSVVETIGEVVKIVVLWNDEEYKEAVIEFFSLFDNDPEHDPNNGDIIFENFCDVLSVCNSFVEFIDSIQPQPKYFSALLDYCINKVNYIVYVQPNSNIPGSKKLIDIYNAAWPED